MAMKKKPNKKDLIFKIHTAMCMAIPIVVIIIGVTLTYLIVTSNLPDWLKVILLY